MIQGTLLQTFQGHQEWINGVDFSPDGQWVVTGAGKNTVKRWKRKRATRFVTTPAHMLKDHTDWVWDVAFDPKGQLIASAGKDDTVKIWTMDGKLNVVDRSLCQGVN